MEQNIAYKNKESKIGVDLSPLDYLEPEERFRLATMLPELTKILNKTDNKPIGDLSAKLNQIGNWLSQLSKDATPEEIAGAILAQPDVIEVIRR